MDIYKINLEIFCDNWTLDSDSKNHIYKFLLQLKKAKTIKEVYYRLIRKMDKPRRQSFLKELPDLELWKKKVITGNIQKKMMEQIQGWEMNDAVNDAGKKMDSCFFPYYDGNNFSVGVLLNDNFEINYNIRTHRPLFRYLFAVIFSQTTNPDLLFEYHFRTTFHGDKKKFLLFLYSVEKNYNDLIEQGRKFWDTWIDLFCKGELPIEKDPSFREILTEDGVRSFDFLVKNYMDAGSEQICNMVLALLNLGYLIPGYMEPITRLHRILSSTFGDIETRQALNKNLLNKDAPAKKSMVSIEMAKILSAINRQNSKRGS